MKKEVKKYNTVGVRFIYGNGVYKIYTYRIVKNVKIWLGMEVVTPPSLYGGKGIGVIVEIHKTPQDTEGYDYKYITEKVSKL
jgi:hypothetical protein